MKLDVIGGSYLEVCIDPPSRELYGSGLRAVCAISGKGFEIDFHTCAGNDFAEEIKYKSKAFGFTPHIFESPKTIVWEYYHPLASPLSSSDDLLEMPVLEAQKVLYYGMHETRTKVVAEFCVYDPQNGIPLRETESEIKNLALVLNRDEALTLSDNLTEAIAITDVGKQLLSSENAKIVIIKDGANGAHVFEGADYRLIPVFETHSVWPIGSGDIFSAAFAWKWMMEGLSSFEAAELASKSAAQYCESRTLPLNPNYRELSPLSKAQKNIYLAGPFFTIGQRFLINETRKILSNFGVKVISPSHDGQVLEFPFSDSEARAVTQWDLSALKNCDAVFAIFSGYADAGTLFEIGFANSLGKKVFVFAENIPRADLVMMIGSECEILEDFSTALYRASW